MPQPGQLPLTPEALRALTDEVVDPFTARVFNHAQNIALERQAPGVSPEYVREAARAVKRGYARPSGRAEVLVALGWSLLGASLSIIGSLVLLADPLSANPAAYWLSACCLLLGMASTVFGYVWKANLTA